MLRIEDIDSPRIKPWATQQAIDDLRWLGIDWDEGPDIGGPHAPYIQTERVDQYADALNRLIADNRVYPCTCTRKDIEAAGSAPHFEHESPIYPGTCGGWQNGDPMPELGTFCWRFRAGDQVVAFADCGCRQTSLARPRSTWATFRSHKKAASRLINWPLSSTMDRWGSTEVVRGNDLIPSTFRQLELFRALAFPEPTFVHVPLVLGIRRTQVGEASRRHAAATLSRFGSRPGEDHWLGGKQRGTIGNLRERESKRRD